MDMDNILDHSSQLSQPGLKKQTMLPSPPRKRLLIDLTNSADESEKVKLEFARMKLYQDGVQGQQGQGQGASQDCQNEYFGTHPQQKPRATVESIKRNLWPKPEHLKGTGYEDLLGGFMKLRMSPGGVSVFQDHQDGDGDESVDDDDLQGEGKENINIQQR